MRITPIFTKNNFSFQKKINSKVNYNVSSDILSNNQRLDKMQPLFNISFGARPAPPVYLIDKNLNCTLFSKQSELAKKLGVSPQRIQGCINGRNPSVDDNVVVYHYQIEKELDDGSRVIDKKKVAELYNRRLNPNSVYAVDYKGDFSYFHKKSDIDSKKGFVIVSASDVESFDDNGEKVIDRKKLSETLIQHPQYSAVYAFDRQSNFVKYKNQADYAAKNGVTTTAVSNAVIKQNRTVNGEYIIPAKEIEKVLDDGTIAIDRNRLAIYFDKKYKPSETRRYTVSEDMQLTMYETSKELAASTGINYATLIHTPDRLTPNGEYIIPASEIEEIAEDGVFEVNQTKLYRAVWERSLEDAVYTIDIDYNIKRHKNKKAVSEALNRSEKTIDSVLYEDGVHQTVADNVVVKASEIESMDDTGNIIIDRKKVTELVQKKLCPRAVYIVAKDGQCKKFKNRFVLAKEFGVPHSRGNLRINGFAVVDAKYLEEINEDGSISLNQEMVSFYASHSKNTF